MATFYTSTGLVRLIGLKRSTLNKWVERGVVTPSYLDDKDGHNSRRLFSAKQARILLRRFKKLRERQAKVRRPLNE